jgi:hypothetical protein
MISRLIVCLSITLPIASLPAFAHPGGLDGRGGHYNRKTGEYHCHRSSCETQVGNKDRRKICNGGYGRNNCSLDERPGLR